MEPETTEPETTEPLALLKLGQNNGNITTVGFGFEVGHPDIDVLRNADHEALNDRSKTMRTWLLSLPEAHQPYFAHLRDLDHLWPVHADAPPVWVSCPDHPELEDAVADHFSVRGHQVKIGEPEAE